MGAGSYGRTALWGALGYGGGLALGVAAFGLILRLNLIQLVTRLLPDDQFFIRLLVGLVLGLVLAGGAGAVSGALGGWAISQVETVVSPRRLIRRSALSLGLTLGILIIPLLFLTALVAFYYDPADRRSWPLITLFAFYGFLFGLLAGFFLALFTSKLRHSWRVLLGSMAGFTLGGGVMGLFVYWHQARGLFAELPTLLYVPLLFLLTGAIGGAVLGLAYHWLAQREAIKEIRPAPRWWQISRAVLLLMVTAVGLVVVWNLINLIRYRDADLQAVIPVGAEGTHWTDLLAVAEGEQPTVFASDTGTPFVAWVGAGDIFYAPATGGAPVNVSNDAAGAAVDPVGVADSQGQVHLVWQTGAGQTVYGRCRQNNCTTLAPLPAGCGSGKAAQPTMAIDANDMIMAVWQEGSGLAFAAWRATQLPETGFFGCVIAGGSPEQPQVAATGNGRFQLIFADKERIFTSNLDGSGWSLPVQVAGGHSPSILATAGGVYLAWCSLDGQVTVQTPAAVQEIIALPSCHGRVALAQDGDGHLHAVWHSAEALKVTGVTTQDESLLYESVRRNGAWSEAAIISQTGAAEPQLTAVSDGVLHLVWAEGTAVTYTSQTQYNCIDPDLNAIERAVYDALNQSIFKPADEQLPVCGNRYETLFYTPNPVLAVGQLPTLNGAFDWVAEMGEQVQYEVLFAVMQWDVPSNEPSPGSTLAQAIVDLYNRVKANPEQHPKGMTVRILTGNMPVVSLLPADDQTWNVLADLRNAGLPELVNEEIGWRLEIADFDGQWPHMHTKMMLVDGKTMMAAGFNYSYLHFSQEHPSQLGLGMVDYGIHVTGPVVQAARAAFDDLWAGSDTLTCDELISEYENVWRRSCERGTAVVTHVPEVRKYYLPANPNADAYALYRTENHLAGDAAIEAALRAAQEKIDISEVNFSLEFMCDAAIVFQGVCTYEDNALPFMTALVETIDTRRIPVRILVEKEAMNGMENRVAIQTMLDELETRGPRDLVEIRFYSGKLHSKAVNVDDQFLIIGSHNFHYSSWGNTPFSLTEFSIGTDNQQAIVDFQTAFEARWADSIPAEELMPALAP
ncbi:MAG: hypothetical protein HND44_07155 [Chloroflexi bacterium]|nr:hypothetical protein [Ardenticatenaceae bacterium]MBL1128266.1 hypothetical protein [Chloroflexota bacterium]NOG34339.1 hypothetical protein [Chloroflexota bacterium]GIK57340.1 MAG: hypothetical protein BroJett015_30030 [Chloroflexota bacterium]